MFLLKWYIRFFTFLLFYTFLFKSVFDNVLHAHGVSSTGNDLGHLPDTQWYSGLSPKMDFAFEGFRARLCLD